MKCNIHILSATVPHLLPMPFTDRYQLLNDVTVVYELNGRRKEYLVPKGFMTDGASIPTILWPLIGSPYSPKFILAAVVHDKQCNDGFALYEMTELFAALLRDGNVKSSLIWKMRLGVLNYMKLQYRKRGIAY